MYGLMPALCLLLGERLRPRALPAGQRVARRSFAAGVADFTMRHRRGVLAGLAVLGLVSLAGLATRRDDWIEYDLSKLRRKDSWVSGERYWGKRMDAATGRYLTPSVVMAENPADVPKLEARLRELMEHGGAGDLIAEVRSAQQLLPDARFQSIDEAKLLKAAITPKLRAKLKDADRELLARALSQQSLVPLSAPDLPEALRLGCVNATGEWGAACWCFPRSVAAPGKPSAWPILRATCAKPPKKPALSRRGRCSCRVIWLTPCALMGRASRCCRSFA